MKKLSLCILALVCLSFYSCEWFKTGGGEVTDSIDSASTTADTFNIIPVDLPKFQEVRGTVGDGTSMNYLELVTEKGDTLSLRTSGANFVGDLYATQKVCVFYNTIEDEDVASVVVNLTQMMSKWAQVNSQGQELGMWLTPDGKVITDSTTTGYTQWEIRDGSFLLSHPVETQNRELGTVLKSDTFTITKLDNEQLQISSHGVGYSFKREL